MPYERKKRRRRSTRRSKKYVRLSRGRRMRRKDYIRGLLAKAICLILLVAVAVTIFRYFIKIETTKVDPIDEVLIESTEDEERDALIPQVRPEQELLAALNLHYAALPAGEVRSFSVAGRYLVDEIDYQFENYAKESDRYRQSITKNAIEHKSVFNGERYFETRDSELVEDKTVGLERLNPYILKMEAAYYALPWTFLDSGETKLRILKPESVMGANALLIENTDLIDVPVLHCLDPETGLEIAREATVLLDEQAHKILIEYNYSKGSGSGARLKGYTVKIDGVVTSSAKIDSMRFNIGMPDWFFEP